MLKLAVEQACRMPLVSVDNPHMDFSKLLKTLYSNRLTQLNYRPGKPMPVIVRMLLLIVPLLSVNAHATG